MAEKDDKATGDNGKGKLFMSKLDGCDGVKHATFNIIAVRMPMSGRELEAGKHSWYKIAKISLPLKHAIGESITLQVKINGIIRPVRLKPWAEGSPINGEKTYIMMPNFTFIDDIATEENGWSAYVPDANN